MYNQDEICNILSYYEPFKKVICSYEKQEIDFIQLQNSINYIFYKNPEYLDFDTCNLDLKKFFYNK
jgi:hypothetical protein